MIRIHGNQPDTFQLFCAHSIHGINATVTDTHDENSSGWTMLHMLVLLSRLLKKRRLSNHNFTRADNMSHSRPEAVDLPLAVLFLEFRFNRDDQLIVAERNGSKIGR
jgi:hypothetical protein